MKTGLGLKEYAISKIGTPYFYGAKMNKLTESMMASLHRSYPSTVTGTYMQKARNRGQVGKINVDCSGLIGAYREKQIGSAQLYSSAKKRLSLDDIHDWAHGVVLYKKGHVAVYIGYENGIPMCVEAKGINYGTIKSRVTDTKWECGLTFADIDYTYDTKVNGTSKAENPYKEPTTTLKKGSKGVGVKWLQFELNESGANLEIDGSFGTKTYQALLDYQRVSFGADGKALAVDGICGKETRKSLKLN